MSRVPKLPKGAWRKLASRDGVLFVSGLAGVIHETFISHTDRPTLLLLFAGMMGLPAFLNSDETKRK